MTGGVNWLSRLTGRETSAASRVASGGVDVAAASAAGSDRSRDHRCEAAAGPSRRSDSGSGRRGET